MSPQSHALKMDRIYGPQLAIYDATRAYYLLGRDQMLAALPVPPGGSILEIGCGTGRNLIRAGRAHPDARLYGLDISQEMLRKAQGALAGAGLSHRTRLAQGDAENFSAGEAFGTETFDCIFFSYALSMIPAWPRALHQALTLLAPAGSLHLVDFGDCSGLPRWFTSALRAWLRKFEVTPRPEAPAVLAALAAENGREARFTPRFRGYAFTATLSPKTTSR